MDDSDSKRVQMGKCYFGDQKFMTDIKTNPSDLACKDVEPENFKDPPADPHDFDRIGSIQTQTHCFLRLCPIW